MKKSRLIVAALGLAAILAGSTAVNAQNNAGMFGLSFSLGVDSNGQEINFIDLFGLPTLVDLPPGIAAADITDSTVYVDGGGKISGFALVSIDTDTGTHSDIVANVTGKLGNKGTFPQATVTVSGKGSSLNADSGLAGKSTFKITFTGVTATDTTLVTNEVPQIDCTNVVQLSNCTAVVTTFTAVTSTNELTNTNATFVTNGQVTVNFVATNSVNSSDNTNVTAASTLVSNAVSAFFTVAHPVVNLCTATTNCANYTNTINTGIASTNGLTTNDVLFTSTVSFSTTNSAATKTNSDGSVVTNSTIVAGSFIFAQTTITNTGVACTTNVPQLLTTVTSTNLYTAIASTAELTNAATLVTNSTPLAGTTNTFVQTNNVVTTTNGTVLLIVAGQVITNTFTFTNEATNVVSPFRIATTSGTNVITNFVNVAVLITNCITNFTEVVTTNVSSALLGTSSGSYKSGIKGDKAISIKNLQSSVSADGFVSNPNAPVDTTIVFFTSKSNANLDVIGKVNVDASDTTRTVLPMTGAGTANSKNKFQMSLKGLGSAKGSSLSLKGTSTGTADGNDLNIDGTKATGKILGQKINSTVIQ